ncbi:MAG: SGNH/GDSL hydrolase family protein [Betaproteobacteria bacterium]
MPHLVLLGDSVFDNGAYTGGRPDVVAQVRGQLGAGWHATLAAVDGSQVDDIAAQLAALPADTTHLVLSAGGNDALLASGLLDEPVYSSADALRLIGATVRAFEARYRACVAACLARGLPLVLCTIYNGNFPDADYAERVAVALAVFNDAILRTALANGLDAIDLRAVCAAPQDYANPIEPSEAGGARIAHAIAQVVTGHAARGARLFGV